MSPRDPGVYLEDIEHYAGLAISFTSGLTLEQYLSDAKREQRLSGFWKSVVKL
jgi:uncharacterized protein with HEPN domain